MFSLIVIVNSIVLIEQVMGLTRADRKYLSEHGAMLSLAKYDIPSLIWPPPLFLSNNCALNDLILLLKGGHHHD
jgi:hypothetical protein